METWKGLSLSTAHVTATDADFLAYEESAIILNRETGFFIYVSPDFRRGFMDCSPSFMKLYDYCLENDYRWLELDNAAETSSKFKTFDW